MKGADPASGESGRPVILLTGFPSYLARRVCVELLAERPAAFVVLLQDENGPRLEAFLKGLPEGDRTRVRPVTGHVSGMDLGMSSEEYRRLVGEVTEIHHLASAYADPGQAAGERLRRVNVQGTREIVELAGQCQALGRLVHWSTIHVSGCRQGVVMEDETMQQGLDSSPPAGPVSVDERLPVGTEPPALPRKPRPRVPPDRIESNRPLGSSPC